MRIVCTEEVLPSGGPGRFVLARAEEAVQALAAEYGGKVQLIYLDPPFGTGDTFHVRLADGKRAVNAPVFEDTLPESEYLAWMRAVLTGCRALLSNEGALYLHIDYRMSAQLRLLLDELFGKRNFLNEIIWSYKTGGRSMRYYPRKHDTIFFYRKSAKCYFDITAVGTPRGPQKRNHMKRFVDESGRICFSIRSGGKTYVYYEDTPMYPTDVWTDIEHLQQKDAERTGYATQKPEALLSRIIRASSRPGDLVVDLFSGGGTTAAAASKLGRRFLAVDCSPFALYTLRARQLASGSALSLLGGSHELTLSYPASEERPALRCSVRETDDALAVTVEEARFDDAHPPVYLALGRAEGARFFPAVTSCSPRLPVTLRMPAAPRPVLQVVDTLGRQAFEALALE